MNKYCEISGYQLLETLQQGSMSAVYKAADAHSNDVFAIKIYNLSFDKKERNLRRYYREISVLTKVEHPNIIRILDYDLLDEFCYLVMPYYPDHSMIQTHPVFSTSQDIHYGRNSFLVNDTIPTYSPATIDDTLRFVQYLLDALQSLKQNHVVHSDLKPSNILLVNKRIPILTDFGHAKLLSYGNNELTQEGYGIGTLRYMAPEQARGEWTITSKADVYAAGAILYELLTKTLPFQANNIQMLVYNHTHAELVQPNTLNPAVDRYLNFIIMKMLEIDPDQRPDIEDVIEMVNFARKQMYLSSGSLSRESFLVQKVGIIDPSPL